MGAQDVSEHAQGAWTGEVSAAMLADFACRYVLVGHSERRSFFGDTDAVVAAKFVAAHRFYEKRGYRRGEHTRFLHDLSHTEEYYFERLF